MTQTRAHLSGAWSPPLSAVATHPKSMSTYFHFLRAKLLSSIEVPGRCEVKRFLRMESSIEAELAILFKIGLIKCPPPPDLLCSSRSSINRSRSLRRCTFWARSSSHCAALFIISARLRCISSSFSRGRLGGTASGAAGLLSARLLDAFDDDDADDDECGSVRSSFDGLRSLLRECCRR